MQKVALRQNQPHRLLGTQKIRLATWHWLTCLSMVGCLGYAAAAGQLQLVTVSPAPAPPGGGGDSSGPIISPDGRYVLFNSTAGNLVLTTNGTPIPARFPAVLNAFLRDRNRRTTTLVSVNLSGLGGGDSFAAGLSANGRSALFTSSSRVCVNLRHLRATFGRLRKPLARSWKVVEAPGRTW